MVLKTDICILGGGVMGLSTAFALTKNSHRQVLLLDRYGIGNDLCSSNDVNRVFRFAYGGDQLYTRMAAESMALWELLELETSQALLFRSGFLLMEGADTEWNRFAEESYTTLKRLGYQAEKLEGAELRKRFPQFSAERAVLDPQAGALLASKILKALHSLVKRQGTKIIAGAQATKLRLSDQPEIETLNGETIRCKKLVITLGVWSNSLLHEGLIKVTSTRQLLIYLKPKTSLNEFRPARFPIFAVDNYYGIPAVGINGVKVTYHGLPERVDPETAKRTIDAEEIEPIRVICRRYIPDLAGGKVVHSKVCLYDMTENSDFVIGADPEYPNVVYGYGFSGHGFKFAPLIGKLLAELALEKPPSFDLNRFLPVR